MKVAAFYLVPKLGTSGAIPPMRHKFSRSAQGQLYFKGTIRKQFSQVLERTCVKTCSDQRHMHSEPPCNGTARDRFFPLRTGPVSYEYLKFGFSGFHIPRTLKIFLLKTGFHYFPSQGITHCVLLFRRQLFRISVLSRAIMSGVYHLLYGFSRYAPGKYLDLIASSSFRILCSSLFSRSFQNSTL